MRFINEYIADPETKKSHPYFEDYQKYSMQRGAREVGETIGKMFGHNEDALQPGKFKLDVQAFPQEKWNDFKRAISIQIKEAEPEGRSAHAFDIIKSLILELEKFGSINHSPNKHLNNGS